MNKCKNCGKETSNPKFCNKSCAAIYNNKKYPKRHPEGNCKTCGKPISTQNKYCSNCSPIKKLNKNILTPWSQDQIQVFEKMHSKHKGTLGETKVTADLYERGIGVAIVVDDLSPFDLIAIDNKGRLYKVQVKCCKVKNNIAQLELRNSMSNKTMLYTKIYTKDEVDVFAMYIPNYDICLYVKSTILDYRKSAFSVRFTNNTKNNQSKDVNFYSDFKNFPIQ